MNEEIDDIDNLIGKVLAGEASADEIAEVDAWKKIDGNQRYFDHLKLIFEQAAKNRVKLNFDADVAWQKVRAKLNEPASFRAGDKGKVVPLNVNYRTALRIAASIVFLLGAGFIGYQWFDRPTQQLALKTDAATAQDTLPDGSTAFLNKNSSIAYEYSRTEKKRKVKLSGEGFFEVKHEEAKPFVIETDEILIRDIGTAFNVKAYPDQDTIEVVVQSGEVQFYTLKDAGVNLSAGETGIYSKATKVFTKIARADTNTLAYKTGVFSFHATDLQSVIDKINEVYGSKIKLGNEKLSSCLLTVSFKNENLNTVVDIIAETLNLSVDRSAPGEIILNGSGCQ